MKSENYVKELFFIFFRQKRLILWVTGLTFLASVLIAFFWPPTYAASGSILVRGKKVEKSPQAIEDEMNRPSDVSKEDLSSEERILVSPSVIERTILSLVAAKKHSEVSGQELVDEVYRVQSGLKTELVPASNVIEISYLSRDSRQALTLLGALMETYIDYRNQVYYPEGSGEYFSENAERYRQKLSGKEAELLSLVNSTEVADPVTELSNNMWVKKELLLQMNQLENEAIDKETLVKYLGERLSDPSMPLFSFIDSVPAIVELNMKLQTLLVEQGAVLQAYNPQSDKARLVTRHVQDSYAALHKEVSNYQQSEQSRLQGIRDKIDSLRRRMEEIDQANLRIQRQIIRETGIRRDITVYDSSFDAFSKRREEASAVSDINMPSQVSIVKKAFPSKGPVFPKKRLVLLFGLLVGFINGFTLGFLIEFFDHTFKKPSDVERVTGMPVIASIPYQ